MKQIVFKGQYGWYIIANNFKDKNDIAYVNLFFPKNSEPFGEEKAHKWIDIEEASFTSYKGKVGLTIWKYKETASPKEESEKKLEQFAKDNDLNFTIEEPPEIDISSDNLPFY